MKYHSEQLLLNLVMPTWRSESVIVDCYSYMETLKKLRDEGAVIQSINVGRNTYQINYKIIKYAKIDNNN